MQDALSHWKKIIDRLSLGWDCLAEYQHNLSHREDIQELLDSICLESTITKEIQDEIDNLDYKFKRITEYSDLCVWDCGPKFIYCGENNIELLPLSDYDKVKYWYYYRWQPDCPYSWKGNNAITYQKEIYGLDFANMSYEQLIATIKEYVSRCDEMINACEMKPKR